MSKLTEAFFVDVTIHVEVNLIIRLSLGSIKTDHVIIEPCYNEVTDYTQFGSHDMVMLY